MTNVIQPSALEAFVTGAIDLSTDDIKVVFCDDTYTYDAGHEDLADVGAGARVATSANLSSKSVTAGVFDAGDVTLSSVTAGDTITQLWIYQDTGVEATSLLIVYMDTRSDGQPISVDTTGRDIVWRWPNGPRKIFGL